ncbi:GCN5-related N-acetyltransferase 7, chloroplastic isoform X2 [Cryptomeria japonica]|uniref:GCN5-related N-acetyltransferase 7, chloroplastic isoform X2 n=1 Tax=Cryptomeria japonica TaxID=3369 RepID=UPI0027DA555B|nr:GCN5-related N-acetyltransferase 7, chloroplastic isoform X2 [Cryptomeria japonica]
MARLCCRFCSTMAFYMPPLAKPFKLTKTAFALDSRKPVHEQHLPLINPKPLYPSNRCNSSPSFVSDLSLNRNKHPGIFCNSALKEEEKGKLLPLAVLEAVSDDALLAASNLRVRTFYDFKQSYGVEEHRRYRSQLEFEALKARIAGELVGFEKVTCVIATIPFSVSLNLTDDLCSLCKGTDAQFTRAYLTNVCVAQELQRKGIGSALIRQAVKIAEQWGMTDLYVHVEVDNDGARCLYEKSGFIYESGEPAWRARFLGRPRRFLLWANMNKLLSHP